MEIVLIVSIRIEDEKRRYLERLKEIITANYQDPEGQESFDLSNSTEENFHNEEEAFELGDDEDQQNEVICRD